MKHRETSQHLRDAVLEHVTIPVNEETVELFAELLLEKVRRERQKASEMAAKTQLGSLPDSERGTTPRTE